MAKFTAQQVAALKPGNKPYKQNVDTGLQLRVATNGVKTWVIQYVVNGRQRELRLSRPYGISTTDGYLSLADARIEAAKVRALAREGIDIQVQRENALATAAQIQAEKLSSEQATLANASIEGLTVNDLFTTWVTDGG